MKDEVRKLFHSLDSADAWESPTDFDREKLLSKIRNVANNISLEFGKKYLINSKIEDASFCAEICLGEINTPSGVFLQRLIFSNFGNIVTINDPDFPASELQVIENILTNNKFTFISIEALEEDYDGKIINKDRIRTWFTRFFDYL